MTESEHAQSTNLELLAQIARPKPAKACVFPGRNEKNLDRQGSRCEAKGKT